MQSELFPSACPVEEPSNDQSLKSPGVMDVMGFCAAGACSGPERAPAARRAGSAAVSSQARGHAAAVGGRTWMTLVLERISLNTRPCRAGSSSWCCCTVPQRLWQACMQWRQAMPPSSVRSQSTLHRHSGHLVVGALQAVRPDVLCPLRQRADAQHHMAGLHPPRSPLAFHQAGKPPTRRRACSVHSLLCLARVTGEGVEVRLRALPATGPTECSVPAGGGSAE